MKQKAFFIIFKGRSLKQITQIFLEGDSPTLNLICLLTLYVPLYSSFISTQFFVLHLDG